MKDIDFDELDRAVSSVLGQQGPAEVTASTTQAVATEEPLETKTVSETGTPVATSAEQAQASPATPLAIKRRGKFMDVMHPSADMTSAAPATPVKPPRTSPVLQPLSTDVAPETSSVDTVESSTDTGIVEPTAKVDESHALIGAEPAPVENLLPEHVAADSEDMAEASDVTAPESSETITPAEQGSSDTSTDQIQDEPVESLYVDPIELAQADEPAKEAETAENPESVAIAADTEQPATPFLADAQVDKRPLGAFGDTETAASETPTPESPEQPSVPVDAQASPAVPLPRELQPDVVQVESASAQEAETSPVPLASGVKSDQEDDGRVEGHPLFDTSTYHEPIAAVHGKGLPGWMKWLIGLLLCLALGAGVGYFLFTAGL